MPRTTLDNLPQRIDALLGTNSVPSPIDRRTVLSALASPKSDIQEIKDRIETLQEELNGLISRKEDLALKVAPYQALLSPFRQIPNEILKEIFIDCLPNEHTPVIDIREPPLLLTQISSHLRQVALTTPRLWTAIRIPLVLPCLTKWRDGRNGSRLNHSWRTMSKYTEAVHAWLARAGVFPVDISVHEFGNSTVDHSIEDLFNVLIHSADQWKSISLHCSGYSIQKFCVMLGKLHLKCDFPHLERLSLEISGIDHRIHNPLSDFNKASHFPHASNLHSIRLVSPRERLRALSLSMVSLNISIAGQCIVPCTPGFSRQGLGILFESRQLQTQYQDV